VTVGRPASSVGTLRLFGITPQRAAHIDELVDEIVDADGE
jgi:hypothetical protein